MKNLFLLSNFCYLLSVFPSHAQIPVADFTTSNTTIEAGSCIQFTDLSTGNPTSWLWSFYGANPGSSTAQNPTICFYYLGTYTVSLRATNAAGWDQVTKTSYITVVPPRSKLIDQQCNNPAIGLPPNTGMSQFHLDPVFIGLQAPEDYRVTIASIDAGPSYYDVQTTGGNASILKSTFSGLEYNRTYMCSVAVKFNGAWGPGGPVCTFSTQPWGFWKESRSHSATKLQPILNMYPNPSSNEGFQISLGNLNEENNQIAIQIYDIHGKQVYQDKLSHNQTELTTRVNSDGKLSSGMYLVNVSVNGKTFNQKIQVK